LKDKFILHTCDVWAHISAWRPTVLMEHFSGVR